MKLTHILLICFISFLFFTYVQCDGNEEEENEEEEKPPQPDVPHGKHPMPFSIAGAVAAYVFYHFYG
ncbi:MEG-11 [Schistosoma mansoni]|uniref:MEG-11 n=1 Tax=Schistosoma mansoni TaxID=6183 RepID=UPI00022C8185|nr:MEG-11 [Schistosoma mansoni]|eukprot:XP_018644032.1 MEG-11 [Schistosoma mansoni]